MLKKISIVFAFVATFALAAYAVIPSGTFGRLSYSTNNVTTSAWTQILPAASMVKAIKGMTISNASPNPVIIGFGSSGAEVAQIIVAGSVSSVYYPIVASQNTRISLKASTATNSVGEIQLSVYYN